MGDPQTSYVLCSLQGGYSLLYCKVTYRPTRTIFIGQNRGPYNPTGPHCMCIYKEHVKCPRARRGLWVTRPHDTREDVSLFCHLFVQTSDLPPSVLLLGPVFSRGLRGARFPTLPSAYLPACLSVCSWKDPFCGQKCKATEHETGRWSLQCLHRTHSHFYQRAELPLVNG